MCSLHDGDWQKCVQNLNLGDTLLEAERCSSPAVFSPYLTLQQSGRETQVLLTFASMIFLLHWNLYAPFDRFGILFNTSIFKAKQGFFLHFFKYKYLVLLLERFRILHILPWSLQRWDKEMCLYINLKNGSTMHVAKMWSDTEFLYP